MNDTVKEVKVSATIIFRNNREYEIPFVNKDADKSDLSTYGTSCNIKEILYTPDSNSFIGTISSNILTIKLTSNDKMLISSYKKSDYYKYMDNTAKIKVSVLGDDGVTTDFGTFYVDSWENGASSSDSTTVTITACDLWGRVKSKGLGYARLKLNTTFSDYISTTLDSINDKLPSSMNVKYDKETLEVLDNNYSNKHSMWYNNVDVDDLESIFNSLSKNTLSYIWVDRTDKLQIDCLIDDKTEEPVCTLSGDTNLFSYNINNSDIYSYNGVRTKYISNVKKNDTQVLSLQDYELTENDSGDIVIETTLNTDKCTNVHYIEIKSDTNDKIYCRWFKHYKDNITMYIEGNVGDIISLDAYGTVVTENYAYKEVVNDNTDNTVSLLEVENLVLYKNNIKKYTSNFAKLIGLKNGQVSCSGYINPQVKLGDMVKLTGSKLDIEDNKYKVIGLDFTFGTSYRCSATLIKTLMSEADV